MTRCCLRPLVALALLLATLPARAEDTAEPAGEALAWRTVPDVVRITETVAPGRTPEQGFGLVVGERAHVLFIATADHVVRNGDGQPIGSVVVTFERDQGTPLPATLLALRLPPAHGDLAVLQVAAPPGMAFSWPPAADIGALALGTRAWRIGKQERWTPSVNPGAYVGTAEAIWLAFDDLDTPPGSSGGPVVTANGVVGLVIADGGSTGDPDRVLPIDLVARQWRVWDLPWNLAARPPAPASVPATAAAPPAVAVAQPPAAPRLPPAQVATPSSLAASAQSFLSSYYASLSDPVDVVLARLPGEVTDPIGFYGKRLARPAFLDEQAKYLRRWPERHYEPRTGAEIVRCDEDASSCRIAATIDYDVRHPADNRHRNGSENVVVELRRVGSRFVIDDMEPASQ